MVDADASASALALLDDSRAATSIPRTVGALPLPFRAGDRWVGTYTCRQGPTNMVILFEEVGYPHGGDARDAGGEAVDVAVIFFAASEGAARMRGTYDLRTRRLRLVGSEWIEQPASYGLINLVGVVNPRASARASGIYSGTVEGSACTSFAAHPEGAFDTEGQEKAGSRPLHPLPPRSLPRARP